MTDRQIELTWRCTSCGTRNLGRHGVCQGCGNPLDGSESWDMPADTTAAPSVTDPALLALAKGGPDWRCAFCGSNQRQADGSCRQCGAGKVEHTEAPAPKRPPIVIRDTGCTWGCGTILLVLVGLVAGAFALVGVGGYLLLRPEPVQPSSPVSERLEEVDVVAEVESARWEHHVDVERLQLVEHEGFKGEIPKGAVGVRSIGLRVHHVDTVQRGWTTETYEEEVPDGTRERVVEDEVDDGFDTRRTTERVRCGETCEPGRETCREVCKPNGNGFATCRKECTRGRERCEPKYCNESRTERTPKTRTVRRTVEEPVTKTVEKTRRVPVWAQVERTAPAFAWKQEDWVLNRVEDSAGEGFEVTEPVLPRGVNERLAGRRGTYTVSFREVPGPNTTSSRVLTWTVPTANDLRELASGGRFVLRVRGDTVLSIERQRP